MEFRVPGEYASIGYTSGAPLQPEPYTEPERDPTWVCPWCKVPWLEGDPFADVRKLFQVTGCPNCGNFEKRPL